MFSLFPRLLFFTGFSLIELMVVLAIISILVTLGIPAYQNYTIRTKISEAFTLTTAAKINLAEFYLSTGGWPKDNTQVGIPLPHELKGHYISQITVHDNAVSTTFNEKILPELTGQNLFFTAIVDTIGQIKWLCEAPAIPKKYLPSNCRGK